MVNKRIKSIIAITTVLVLGAFNLNYLHACESKLKSIDGITCELQYALCSVHNQDIKVCRKVKGKVKRVKKSIKKLDKKIDKIHSDFKKASKVREKTTSEIEKSEVELTQLRMLIEEVEALVARNEIYENFVGTEGLRMLNSEKFIDDVNEVLQR